MNVTDFMSWKYEGYTTLKLVWIAASKAFSNSSNEVNALRQSNLKIESDFNWLSWENISTTTENYKFSETFGSFTADITLEIASYSFTATNTFSYNFGCTVI